MRLERILVATILVAACQCSVPAERPGPAPAPSANSDEHRHRDPPSSGLVDGHPMIGQPAPAWNDLGWVDEPLRLEAQRGKVVLVRFFTNTCPFCRATAPVLRQLDETYRDHGLLVVGVYHPKPPREVDVETVRSFASDHGWKFPVALDSEWKTLDRYWPPEGRRFTSFSLIVDKSGTIRFAHRGPEFHPDGPPDHDACRADYAQIVETIESLLAEPAT